MNISKKTVFIGCGAFALLGVIVVGVVIAGFAYLVQDAKGLGLSIEGPSEAIVGQVFELKITVTNERPRKVLALSDLDLAEDYLAGFTVARVEPAARNNQHVPLANTRSFHFGVSIPAKSARTFTFKLRPIKNGVFRGDVDAWEGARFVTGTAETLVKEAPAAGGNQPAPKAQEAQDL